MENIGWQHCVLFVAKLCTFLLQNTTVEIEIVSKLEKLTNMRNIRSYIEDYIADKILNLYIKNQEK